MTSVTNDSPCSERETTVKRFLGIATLPLLAFVVVACAHMTGGDWVTLLDGQTGLDN